MSLRMSIASVESQMLAAIEARDGLMQDLDPVLQANRRVGGHIACAPECDIMWEFRATYSRGVALVHDCMETDDWPAPKVELVIPWEFIDLWEAGSLQND